MKPDCLTRVPTDNDFIDYEFKFKLENEEIIEHLDINDIFNKEYIKYLLHQKPSSNEFKLIITKQKIISISQGSFNDTTYITGLNYDPERSANKTIT